MLYTISSTHYYYYYYCCQSIFEDIDESKSNTIDNIISALLSFRILKLEKIFAKDKQ